MRKGAQDCDPKLSAGQHDRTQNNQRPSAGVHFHLLKRAAQILVRAVIWRGRLSGEGPTPFPHHFHPKEVTIPRQENEHDCGVYAVLVAVGIVKSFNSRTGAIRENFDFEVARNIAGTKVFRPDVYDVQG